MLFARMGGRNRPHGLPGRERGSWVCTTGSWDKRCQPRYTQSGACQAEPDADALRFSRPPHADIPPPSGAALLTGCCCGI